MIKKSGRSIGRTILTSSKMMDLLPWVGIGVAFMGLLGLFMGLLTIFITGQVFNGATSIILGTGLMVCGIALFFAMCIVQDLTGMF